MQPAPGPGLDAARDLLRAAASAGPAGAIVGGLGFIAARGRPDPGAVGAVPVAARRRRGCAARAPGRARRSRRSPCGAGLGLARPSWRRAATARPGGCRWLAYALLGGAGAALIGPYLVLVLVGCGAGRARAVGAGGAARLRRRVGAARAARRGRRSAGVGALAWVAFKVGALSFGGGFVIVPLMQHDAVHTYHWMTATALPQRGRARPGDARAGRRDRRGRRLRRPRARRRRRSPRRSRSRRRSCSCCSAAATSSGCAAIAARSRSSTAPARRRSARSSARRSRSPARSVETWQFVVLGVAAVALLLARRGVVATLVGAGVVGVIVGAGRRPTTRVAARFGSAVRRGVAGEAQRPAGSRSGRLV